MTVAVRKQLNGTGIENGILGAQLLLLLLLLLLRSYNYALDPESGSVDEIVRRLQPVQVFFGA